MTEGDRAWTAKLRIAAMMAKKGDVAGARRYLASLKADGAEQRIERTQTEAQLLRDSGDNEGAYAVLTAGLVTNPDSADLLYDIAMVAEKLDRLEEAEKRLNQLIALKPDNAQALNALGYTLVDRTQRTAEGMKLIEQALALAPADPFILDSMGWAHYRMGNLDDSEKFLRRALADRSDPEIAAHLGEVLWAKGERARAQEVWQSQLKQTPDNALLLETVRRFAPVAPSVVDAIARRPRSPRRKCRLRARPGGMRRVGPRTPACRVVAFAAARPSFEAAGGFRCAMARDALTANFRWRHDGNRDEVDLASPLGQTIARLSGARRRRRAAHRRRTRGDRGRLGGVERAHRSSGRCRSTASRSGSRARPGPGSRSTWRLGGRRHAARCCARMAGPSSTSLSRPTRHGRLRPARMTLSYPDARAAPRGRPLAMSAGVRARADVARASEAQRCSCT